MMSKHKHYRTTEFSEFIRNASEEEKKRVYLEVMDKAIEMQLAVIRKARSEKQGFPVCSSFFNACF